MAGRFATYDFDHDRQTNAKARNTKQSDIREDKYVGQRSTGPFLPSGIGKYVNILVKYSFYLSIFCLLSFVILIVLQYLGFKTLSFMPDDGGLITMPLLPTNRQISNGTTILAADASANLLYLVPSNYTISIDLSIKNTFENQSIPRVILYRSDAPVVLTSADNTIDLIADKMLYTNFILYLDPHTNDLNAVVYTTAERTATPPSTASGTASGRPSGRPSGTASGRPSGTASGRPSGTASGRPSESRPIESGKIVMTPIKNVPLKTPFRITMMLSDVLLEIYIDGDLQRSVPLIGGTPITTGSNINFYGPPTIVGRSVLISNVSYWNTILTSKSIRTYGKESINSSVLTV